TASTMVVVNNPAFTTTNGLPRQVIWTQAGISNGTPGGIITAGPLKGIAFGPGGTPYTFQYGSLVSGNFMQGGAWQTVYPGPYAGDFIDLPESRQMVFARASYDVTDNFNLFVQGQFARSATFDRTLPYAYLGNLTIKSDNAFIPASVRAQVTAAGLTSFAFGSTNIDIPSVGSDNERALNRYVIGGSGKFDFLGNPWSYNFYYQYGKVRNSIDSFNALISARYALAIDAVTNPANGQIVCRSTLTNPTNGCVPYNVFGIGVNNQQVLNYLLAHAHLNYDNVQQAEEAVVTGPIAEGWAGPISAAFSVAHRSEKTYGVGDPISAGLGFFTSNFIPTLGSYNVTEGSAELDVPLAKDTSWAKSLDLSVAARFTDYTTSGYVTTWKVGGIWTPIDDIKFRATRSRDIRAPTLAQLFATSSGGGSAALLDPFTNTQPSIQALNSGNINLKPERADETELGVVLQPFFWPGFSFSVDYWHIKINDAIASAGGQNAINLCFTKGQFCDQLKRNSAGVLTQVYNLPLNLAAEDAKGLDFELGYRIPLADINSDWDGAINLHSNTTIYIHDITSSPILPTRDIDGVSASNGAPNWSSTSTLGYSNDVFSASVSARMISSGVINNTYVQCTSSCPASTVTDPTVDFNHVPGVVYLDTSLTYKLPITDDISTEIFFNVRNLLDKDPPPTPSTALQQTGGTWGFQAYKYDVIGRAYRLGVRFKL
ncbi:MAG: TonB-dependent receptor domain-containing protein, partial [Rhodospirillaceae bacterium]